MTERASRLARPLAALVQRWRARPSKPGHAGELAHIALSTLVVFAIVARIIHQVGGRSIALVSPFPPFLVSIAAAAFLLTSCAGAFRNRFEPRQQMLAVIHSVTTLVFIFVLFFICLASPSSLFQEVAVAAPIVLVIHTLCWWLDRSEARLLQKPVRHAHHVLEAAGYLAVIVCAQVAAASKDYTLMCCALVLSVMLVLLELKSRTWDEIRQRLDPQKARKRDAVDRRIPFSLAVADVFARIFKSTVYISVGFALLYENLALIEPEHSLVITHASHNPFVDYLYFSLGMIHHNAYGDVTLISAPAKILAGTEQVISSVMLSMVAAMLIESVHSRYRDTVALR